ncbi:MAG: N-acetylmuramoyl-L-alanine amidase-like domain-containing protein [Xenococcaceae cyanobacterium]
MQKFFGLAVVALGITVGIAFHSTSQARVNHSHPFPSTFAAIVPLNNNLSTGKQDSHTPSIDIPKTADGERFQNIIQYAIAANLPDAPMGEIMQAIAEQFLGAQYKVGLLDQSDRETLVVSLKNFDCVLFVETVLAIARGVAIKDYQYQTFTNRIVNQRYWNGHMNDYCSRLHYFSQWISDNQRRGTVQNIAPYLGGVSLDKKLNFMSTHRSLYLPMASNDANYRCIVEMEANLDGLTIDYIPHNQIKSIYHQLQSGDIIGIATNIPGLDITHTGLVYHTGEGNMGLIHASPIGKVTIASDLHRYVGNVKNAIGILVARPIDPRQIIPNTVLFD